MYIQQQVSTVARSGFLRGSESKPRFRCRSCKCFDVRHVLFTPSDVIANINSTHARAHSRPTSGGQPRNAAAGLLSAHPRGRALSLPAMHAPRRETHESDPLAALRPLCRPKTPSRADPDFPHRCWKISAVLINAKRGLRRHQYRPVLHQHCKPRSTQQGCETRTPVLHQQCDARQYCTSMTRVGSASIAPA